MRAAVAAVASPAAGRRRASSRRRRQKGSSSSGAPASLAAKAEALRLGTFKERHRGRFVVASVGRRRQRRGFHPPARAGRGRGMA